MVFVFEKSSVFFCAGFGASLFDFVDLIDFELLGTLLQAGLGVLLGTVRCVVLSDLSVIGISNTPFIFGVLTRPGDFDRPEAALVELTGALVTRRLDSKIE